MEVSPKEFEYKKYEKAMDSMDSDGKCVSLIAEHVMN